MARVGGTMVAHTMGTDFIGDAGFHPTGNILAWSDIRSSAARSCAAAPNRRRAMLGILKETHDE